MKQQEKLYQRISYGMGDFAVNGMFTFVSTYLLYYYTDVVKIDLAVISVVMLIGRTADAVCSILVGGLVDRTKSRFGKCRPYLLFCSPPLGVMLGLLFYVPAIDSGKGIYCAVIYILFSVFYALVNVPYSTLLSLISRENAVRIRYNVFKIAGANLGGMLVTMFTLRAVQKLERPGVSGYTLTAAAAGVLAVAGLWLCAAVTKEKVRMQREEKLPLKEFGRVALHNRHWLVFCGVMFISILYMTLHNQTTIYYAKYCLGRENISSFLLTLTPLACVVVAFIMPGIAGRVGMKKITCIGNIMVVVSLAGTWLLEKSQAGLILCSAFTSIGWAVASSMVFVMIPQLIDFTEWRDGCRAQGLMTSIVTFLMKMGAALSGLIGPLVLQAGGYQAAGNERAATLFTIRMNYLAIPAVLAAAVILLMRFYGLDEIYETVSRELRERE